LAITSVHELAPEFDERAVVEAARHGDAGALSNLYEHYFPRVYRYVFARLGQTEDAEEVRRLMAADLRGEMSDRREIDG